MTEITIHVPSRLKPFIASKLREGYESAESYLLTLVEAEQLHDARAGDLLESLSRADRARLNAMLAERAKGPFDTVDPLDETYFDSIKVEGRRAAQKHGPNA